MSLISKKKMDKEDCNYSYSSMSIDLLDEISAAFKAEIVDECMESFNTWEADGGPFNITSKLVLQVLWKHQNQTGIVNHLIQRIILENMKNE